MSRPGELTKTNLLREVLWPKITVGPGALRRIVNEARKALGDRGDTKSWIQTRKGLGYVFVGPVSRDRAGGHEWPYVGRSAELEAAERAIAEGSRGRGSLCFVRGSAGTGKSALLSELRRRARGTTWLVGHCQSEAGAPAFWAFREIVKRLAAIDDHALRFLGLAERQPLLRALIPELVPPRGVPDASNRSVPSAPPRFDAEGRFVACDAFASELARSAEDNPVCVVIEDAHWADEGTVLLVGLLARAAAAARMVLLVTYRPEETPTGSPLGRMIAQSGGRDGVRTLSLDPWTTAELRELLEVIDHPSRSLASIEALKQLTGGNPLFVREVVRQALSGGSGSQVPPDLAHVIAHRKSRLPAPTERLLGAASVLGTSVSLRLLAAVTTDTARAVSDGLLPALNEGILVVNGDDEGVLDFAHALFRDAVYAAVPIREREALHAAAVAAWERSEDSGARDEARAVHAYLAGAAVPKESAAAFCLRAGQNALAAEAFDRAAVHLDRAAELVRSAPPSTEKAELFLARARARWHIDDSPDRVAECFLEAAAEARGAGSLRLVAESIIGSAVGDESLAGLRDAWWRKDTVQALEDLLLALESESGEDLATSTRHRVARALCWLRAGSGDNAAAAEAARTALACAPAAGDALGALDALDALDAWSQALLVGLRCGEALWSAEPARARPFLDELCAQATRSDLAPRQGADATVQAMAVCLVLGEGERYRSLVEVMEDRAGSLPEPLRFGKLGARLSRYRLSPLLGKVTCAVIAGELDVAVDAISRLPAAAERLGLERTREGDDNALLMLLQLFGYRGHASSVSPMLDRYAQDYPEDSAHVAIGRAQIALEQRDFVEARRQFDVLAAADFKVTRGGTPWPAKPEARVRLADIGAAIGTPAEARKLYESLIRGAELCASEGIFVGMGAYSRPLGELAARMNDLELARVHFERALTLNLRFGHRPEITRTRLGLARVLRAQGHDDAYRAECGAALEAARAMGMTPAVEVAERLVSGSNGAPGTS